MSASRWNESQILQIKELLIAGKTYGEIGEIFHATRNAIIGIVHRAKLRKWMPPKQIMLTPPKKKPTNYTINKPDRRGGDHGKKSRHCAPLPVESVHVRKPVEWPPKLGECLAIIGEPRALMCCGQSVVPAGVYCLPHHKAHYVPHTPRA